MCGVEEKHRHDHFQSLFFWCDLSGASGRITSHSTSIQTCQILKLVHRDLVLGHTPVLFSCGNILSTCGLHLQHFGELANRLNGPEREPSSLHFLDHRRVLRHSAKFVNHVGILRQIGKNVLQRFVDRASAGNFMIR